MGKSALSATRIAVVWFVCCVAITQAAMVLTSPEFVKYELIPGDYGCDIVTGEDRDPVKPNPPLEWTRVPAKTQSFVLLMDHVGSNTLHWLATNIPRDVRSIEVGASGISMPVGSEEYINGFGTVGYAGPCPSGTKETYRFRLFAMQVPNVTLDVTTGSTSEDITNQLVGLDEYVAVLPGMYYSPSECPVPVLEDGTCPCPGVYCPITCPVPVAEGEPCPCPGPGCEEMPRIPKIRYVKPSETLSNKRKPLNLRRHDKNLVPQPDCSDMGKSIAQTIWADDVKAEIMPMPAPNSLAEPLSKEEAKKRGVRTASWPAIEGESAETVALLQGDLKVVDADGQEKSTSDDSSPTRKCCSKTKAPKTFGLTLWTPAFSTGNGTRMAAEFICPRSRPANSTSSPAVSPPFSWRHAPKGTQSFTLMMDELTIVDDELVGRLAWLVTNISVDVDMVLEGASQTALMPTGAVEAFRYVPPCPRATATYRARIFALPHTAPIKVFPQVPVLVEHIEQQLKPLQTGAVQLDVRVE